MNLNENIYLREIFTLIFPEFENLDRLKRLVKICDNSQITNKTEYGSSSIGTKNNAGFSDFY